MIRKDLGFAEILITDTEFGHVGVFQKDFKDRLEENGRESYPTFWMQQEHSSQVRFCGSSQSRDRVFESCDGLITGEVRHMLVTKTADCVPILLWSKKHQIVAALHAGWKGFLAGIIPAFAEAVKVNYGFDIQDFQAYLGPHIRTSSFEIQDEFIAHLPEKWKQLVEEGDGKKYFNLTNGVREELNSCGIFDIEDCEIDTYQDSDYFSYRRWCHLPDADRPEHYSTFASTIVMR